MLTTDCVGFTTTHKYPHIDTVTGTKWSKNCKVHSRARPRFVMALVLGGGPPCSRLGGVSFLIHVHNMYRKTGDRRATRLERNLQPRGVYSIQVERRTSPHLGIVTMAKSALIREQNMSGSMRTAQWALSRMDLELFKKEKATNGRWMVRDIQQLRACSDLHQT